ncbi:MAG TPA: signal peptide peptidase SppA [Fibrobacteria bacterium]|nr:signal peptide peptidase SppA [Fibrobacteria bacterium]
MQESWQEPRRPGSALSRFVKLIIVLVIAGGIALCLLLAAIVSAVGRYASSDEMGPHLVLLSIEGPIYDAGATLAILDRIREDDECKGVLLRVDSPGGAVGASQEIFASLKALRAAGKPLAVSFGNIAASGGYYVSLAGEKIFANPGTLTGSIGVIVQFPEVEELLKKAGVSLQTVKSGALKDVGSPARKATPDELAYLQGVIDDSHDQFVGDVAAARGLSPDSVRRLADGRVYTGRQARALGLVDTLGGLDAAQDWLEERTGLKDAEWVTEPRPRSRLEEFLDPDAETGIPGLFTSLRNRLSPGTFFMWP